MANFSPKQIDLSADGINGGVRYVNGDILPAETINAALEGVAYLQSKIIYVQIDCNNYSWGMTESAGIYWWSCALSDLGIESLYNDCSACLYTVSTQLAEDGNGVWVKDGRIHASPSPVSRLSFGNGMLALKQETNPNGALKYKISLLFVS